MKYNTPELLHVGAAQNFVLGGDSKFNTDVPNYDDDLTTYSVAFAPDSNFW